MFSDLSVNDNIDFWASAYRVKNKDSNLLDDLGLLEISHKKVKKLSGGMKRRLMIAVSILHSPEYILLDEPNTGLDFYYKEALYAHLKKLKAQNKAVLYAGHDIDQMAGLCDNILILNKGKLEEDIADEAYKNIKDRIKNAYGGLR